MVYGLDILNANNEIVSIQTVQPQGAVITWNGTAISGGPTPFLSIETSTETNEDQSLKSINTKLNLDGVLINSSAPGSLGGISGVANKILALNNLFNSGCRNGILAVTYNNVPLLSWDNVKFLSSNFNTSNDQWTISCPYTISLEKTTYAISGYRVKDMKDDWTIEQLEDDSYENITMSVKQQVENHNPRVAPGSAATATPSNIGRPATEMRNLNIYNLPKFRVSRTVGAVGRPSNSSCVSGIDNNAYLEAKRWVEDRAAATWSSRVASTTGMIKQSNFSASSTPPTAAAVITDFNTEGAFFHNYMRTTNLDVVRGSYEITETFLVLPRDIGYYEEYSVDMSTNEQYITTVRVQGTVNGLSLFIPESMNKTNIAESGTRNISTIVLSGSIFPTSAGARTTTHLDSFGQQSFFNQTSTSKYGNAVSGWLFDVKPYLYRRACLVTNSSDRNRDYIPATLRDNMGNQPPANNPMYSYQAPVNIIPISTSETHDPRTGTVSYSYEFNNQFKLITGTIYENISIEDTMPNDVISEAFVFGRRLGPLLLDLNTVTSSHKTVTVEVGVMPPSGMNGLRMQHPSCPMYISGTIYKDIDTIVSGFAPFGAQTAIFGNMNIRQPMPGQVYVEKDTQNWQATDGKYSRTVGWIYQQCGNQRNTMDH